jgi:hypothetical protein
LHDNDINYMLSGSMAMAVYTLPRATRDFDFVVQLSSSGVDRFIENFSEGFYCERTSIEEAINFRSMFNIIDHATGFKADFMILKNEEYRQTEFQRRVMTEFLDTPVWIVSAEDLMISKIIWIQEIQSAKQIEDISSLKAMNGLDWNYINGWTKKLKLNTFGLI